MTCGLVRLICEEPMELPEGQESAQKVIDVAQHEVAATVARLQNEGWQYISEWPL